MIYMDYAATTPMSEEALQTFVQASQQYFGNEQSLHDTGTSASALLQACRKEFAEMIGGKERGVYFTSGGSESNYLALHSLLTVHDPGSHIITTEIEHASIRNYFRELEKKGYAVTYMPVDRYGLVDIGMLENAITEKTVLVSIQHANSEIGTVQNIEKIGKLLKRYGILFHTDCVQTFGKLPIDVSSMHIDSLSVSAHKIYGPKGVGACYINPQVRWRPIFEGTSHEGGFRPGTVNVPGIASFITAARHMLGRMEQEAARLAQLRRLFVDGLQSMEYPISIEGHPSACLPNIIGITIKGIEGQYTMLECNRHGIAVSVGSACQIGKQEPSKTMLAIGKEAEEAKQYVRFSFGVHTTKEQIYKTLEVLGTMLQQFFKGAGLK